MNRFVLALTYTVYTLVSSDLVYHATLKILPQKHYFIIYYEYHASCIFESIDNITLISFPISLKSHKKKKSKRSFSY